MDGGGRQCGGRVRRKKKMCWSKGWIKERKMKGEGFNKEKWQTVLNPTDGDSSEDKWSFERVRQMGTYTHRYIVHNYRCKKTDRKHWEYNQVWRYCWVSGINSQTHVRQKDKQKKSDTVWVKKCKDWQKPIWNSPPIEKVARAQEVRWKEKKKRQIILNQPEKEKERGRNKL